MHIYGSTRQNTGRLVYLRVDPYIYGCKCTGRSVKIRVDWYFKNGWKKMYHIVMCVY